MTKAQKIKNEKAQAVKKWLYQQEKVDCAMITCTCEAVYITFEGHEESYRISVYTPEKDFKTAQQSL